MEYYRPESFAEALPLLSEFGDSATVIAGGTDLLVDMKFRGFRPACLIICLSLVTRQHQFSERPELCRGKRRGIEDWSSDQHPSLVEE